MNSSYRKATVCIQEIEAGSIEETEEGYVFRYIPAYLEWEDAVPASLTLPLSPEPYFAGTLFPFFDGLIPEGWLLQLAQKTWKLDGKDRFGVLLAACNDCIGDVSIRPVNADGGQSPDPGEDIGSHGSERRSGDTE